MGSIANIGSGLGAAFSMVFSGQLISLGYTWGQQYYMVGGISLVISLVWFAFADDSPEQDEPSKFRPFRLSNQITAEERELIIKNRPSKRSGKRVPWRKLICSKNIWLFSTAWFLATVAYIAMNTFGMRYIVYITQMDIKKATQFGGVVALLSFPILFCFSVMTDYCQKNYPSQFLRKTSYTCFTFVAIASLVPGSVPDFFDLLSQ